MKRLVPVGLIALVFVGCLGDPVGPDGLVVEGLGGAGDSLLVGAPGRALGSPIALQVRDGGGRPVPAVEVRWAVVAGSGSVSGADAQTGRDGIIRATWVLGTRAAEPQRLLVQARIGRSQAEAELDARAIPVEVSSVALLADTTSVRVAGPGLVTAEATDPFGNRFVPANLRFRSLDSAVATIDSSGRVNALRRGYARVVAEADGLADTACVHVIQVVASVAFVRDTIGFHSLGQAQPLAVTLLDDQGLPVVDSLPAVAVADPTVASVDSQGLVRALANGTTVVTAVVGDDSARAFVRVAQRPFRVQLPSDTVRFDALGQEATIAAVALDSLGSPVVGSVADVRPADTSIVGVLDSVRLRSRTNGVTVVTFAVAGLPAEIVAIVEQVPVTITAAITFGRPIVTLPVGAPLPLSCQIFDGNGFAVARDPQLTASTAATVVGTTCTDARVQRSGLDTLTFALGPAQARVPVVIAAAPTVSSPIGEEIQTDTLPGLEAGPWAPSAHLNAAGEIEVYYTASSVEPDSTGYTRGDLHRIVRVGGRQFRYDGLVLRHDDDICNPQGQGIENVALLPRADGPGWRMLYAAGSNECYGWQVFSAVSPDGRVWTKEPGIRLSNGGTQIQGQPPWPAGEGMVVDQLPSGEWRMIAGTFEHVTPPDVNTWQITEWRSPDQLTWTYVGTVLTTRDMPTGWQGSVYSPAVREVAPGVWRMLFTADGRGSPGARSAIWSAVSVDRVSWQLEGEILGEPDHNIYYVAVAGDLAVFVRQDPDGTLHLATSTVTMP